jgi:hypothetical protein
MGRLHQEKKEGRDSTKEVNLGRTLGRGLSKVLLMRMWTLILKALMGKEQGESEREVMREICEETQRS